MLKNGHRPEVDLNEEEGGDLAAIKSDKKREERRRQPRIITTLLLSDLSGCQPWKTWDVVALSDKTYRGRVYSVLRSTPTFTVHICLTFWGSTRYLTTIDLTWSKLFRQKVKHFTFASFLGYVGPGDSGVGDVGDGDEGGGDGVAIGDQLVDARHCLRLR